MRKFQCWVTADCFKSNTADQAKLMKLRKTVKIGLTDTHTQIQKKGRSVKENFWLRKFDFERVEKENTTWNIFLLQRGNSKSSA